MGIEEHLLRIMRTIGRFRPAHIVVGAISRQSAWARMPHVRFPCRLLSVCREQGITCFYVNQAVRRSACKVSAASAYRPHRHGRGHQYVWESGALAVLLRSQVTGRPAFALRHRLAITDSGIWSIFRRPTADGENLPPDRSRAADGPRATVYMILFVAGDEANSRRAGEPVSPVRGS
jgi:hypothetical protein